MITLSYVAVAQTLELLAQYQNLSVPLKILYKVISAEKDC